MATPPASRRRAREAAASVLPVVGLLAVACSSTWLVGRFGGASTARAGLEIPVLRPVLLALLAGAAVGLVAEGLVLGRWPLVAPAVAGTALGAIAVGTLVGAELLPVAARPAMVPVTAGRYAVDLHAGAGLWLALLAAPALVMSARTGDGVIGAMRLIRPGGRPGAVAGLPGPLVAAGLVALAGWSRYRPWMLATAGAHRVELPGLVVPLAGPASLAALLAMAGTLAALAWRQTTVSALGVVAAGWTLSFVAAAVIVGTATAGLLHRAVLLLPAGLGDRATAGSVSATGSVWLTFATGLATAAWGMVAVHRVERAQR